MGKKGYYLNPIVRRWINEGQLTYSEFATLAGVCPASICESLSQSRTPGVKVRRGILKALAGIGHKVQPAEIFSTNKYPVE